MLEITGDDIAALADDDLRSLVARLCEAEMRQRGFSAAAVTWGGAQDAPDGGIDVRVELPAGTPIEGFVPSAATGFQVKKPDMPPAAIMAEMRPNGMIRPSIQDLADNRGAYIIVSGTGSTADEALHRRREAMAAAIKGVPNGDALALDLYDRMRIATWLRDHPGLVPWSREKAGRPIAGWQSFGAWANPAEGVAGDYLADDAARIRTGTLDGGQGITAVEGINRIRERLGRHKQSVRLVGLSGVGKTRLAQALFDDRIGADALDPSLAIYTNLSDGPEPSPVSMLSNILAARMRLVMVVDNCPPDLHRRLAEIASGTESQASVLTIEYDIREDQPEGTEVFEMEPASTAMTEALVRRRFPDVSQVDAGTIGEFSGGNARIAIALAGTINRGDSLSGLADEELFRRLFHQNHQPDPDLLRAAEACALVYSFDGENPDDDGELARLGNLARQDPADLYARVAELRRRDLVQARRQWRAVLPHAVANRLAKRALKNIPLKAIETELANTAPDRIKRSFSRRLGYLHDDPEASRIVEGWLRPGGVLAEVAEFDALRAEMFLNVAPVAPEPIMAALERAAKGPKKAQLLTNQYVLVRLLRSLAYEPTLFARCAELLAVFAILDDKENESEAAKALTSLFFAYLSGTHATVEQRVRVMEELIRSGDAKRQSLGLEALKSLLESWRFMSAYDFEFGARSRDHGYHPNFEQLGAWYATVLRAAEAIALSDLPAAAAARRIIGSAFRGLWTSARMYDDLERVSRALIAKSYWREGWIATRETLRYDGAGTEEDMRQRLIRLEQELRPRNLVQKVRSIVLSRAHRDVDLNEYKEDDGDDAGKWFERAEKLAARLGEEVVADDDALHEMLPELISGSGKLISFGSGLALGASAPRTTWEVLTEAFCQAPGETRGTQLLTGFLRKLAERDPVLAGALLSESIEHPVLGASFPDLQCSVEIDPEAVERLHRSLASDLAPIDAFRRLAWGQAHSTVTSAGLKDLVERIAAKPRGTTVALEIVSFRFLGDRDAKRDHEPEIVEAGRKLLAQLEFCEGSEQLDHKLRLVVAACLVGAAGDAVAARLCKEFKLAVANQKAKVEKYHDFFEMLCKVQPRTVLDTVFAGNEQEHRDAVRMMRSLTLHRRNPLDAMPEDEVFAWCDLEPEPRYLTMASVVSHLQRSEEDPGSHWSGIALKMMKHAPDPVAVARAFVKRFRPSSGWSGSLAVILEGRKALLSELEQHPDPRLAEFARAESVRFAEEIEAERRWEEEHSRARDQRFE